MNENVWTMQNNKYETDDILVYKQFSMKQTIQSVHNLIIIRTDINASDYINKTDEIVNSEQNINDPIRFIIVVKVSVSVDNLRKTVGVLSYLLSISVTHGAHTLVNGGSGVKVKSYDTVLSIVIEDLGSFIILILRKRFWSNIL